MTDLVERLRKARGGLCTENPAHYAATRLSVADALEAADRIEELEATHADIVKRLRDFIGKYDCPDGVIEEAADHIDAVLNKAN